MFSRFGIQTQASCHLCVGSTTTSDNVKDLSQYDPGCWTGCKTPTLTLHDSICSTVSINICVVYNKFDCFGLTVKPALSLKPAGTFTDREVEGLNPCPIKLQTCLDFG